MVQISIHSPAVYSFPVTFQLVQSYTFSWSFVVSYQAIHSVGLEGALLDAFISFTVTAQVLLFTLVTGNVIAVSVIAVTCHNVFVVIVATLVDVHLEVYAVCVVSVFCFALRAAASAVLSVGCHAIALKLTSTAVFFCNNQLVPS